LTIPEETLVNGAMVRFEVPFTVTRPEPALVNIGSWEDDRALTGTAPDAELVNGGRVIEPVMEIGVASIVKILKFSNLAPNLPFMTTPTIHLRISVPIYLLGLPGY
jgi:hypothetical protein